MTTLRKVLNYDVIVGGGPIKVARLDQEWYKDLDHPEEFIAALRKAPRRPDIFTFWQRLPDVTPVYSYYREDDDMAALPITTYEHWWSAQIKSRTRGLIRKAAKEGVVVKEVDYTDDFVRGITEIFNETPLRQGRPFWHFGKDFATIKREFSKYLFRETLLGAFLDDELIGFMMLGDAGRYFVTGQIISKICHRDKCTNNALIAKAVELCAGKCVPYLVYLRWGSGSLAEFKRRNGFERVILPRYFVPLTARGRFALRFRLHRGLVPLVPESMLARLRRLRAVGYRAAYAVRYPKRRLADGDI